jgi:hypothetical protein
MYQGTDGMWEVDPALWEALIRDVPVHEKFKP